MYVRKNLRWEIVWQLTRRRPLIFTVCNTLICGLYGPLNVYLPDIPWQPVTLLGTAVVFSIGFKSNGSHDRFWEGRQLWGSIVNTSRVWAIRTFDFVQVVPDGVGPDPRYFTELHRRLLYRQIAWVNALRLRRQTAVLRDAEVAPLLLPTEVVAGQNLSNPPTHLLRRQSVELRGLYKRGLLTEFCQVALMQTIQDLLNAQGGCEHTKEYAVSASVCLFWLHFLEVFADVDGDPAELSSFALLLTSRTAGGE